MSDSESESAQSDSSNKILWKHYNRLVKSPDFLPIYNRFPQPITQKKYLKELITETEKALSYSIPNAYERFSQRENPNDPSDNVHLRDISFKAFMRRLSNVILERIYSEGNFDKTLKEFIIDVRGEENISSLAEKSSSEQEKEESLEIEKSRNSSQHSSENSNEVQKNRSFEEEESGEYRKSGTFKDESDDQKSFKEKKPKSKKIAKKSGDSSSSKESFESEDEKNEEKLLQRTVKKDEKIVKKQTASGSANPKANNSELNLKIQDPNKIKKNQNTSLTGIPKKSKKDSSSSSSDFEDKRQKPELSSLNSSQYQDSSNSHPDHLTRILLAKTIPEPSKKTWFSNEIKGKESDFKSLFLMLNGGKEFVIPAVLPKTFERSLKKLKVTPHEHHKVWFKSIHEALHPVKMVQKSAKKNKMVVPKITFLDFIEIMNLWGEKYLKEQATVVGDLVRTVDEYLDINRQVEDYEKISKATQELTHDLERLLSTHLEFSKSNSGPEDKLKKNLDDIFQFYAKVQRIQGTDDTFDSLETSNTNLNLGSFLKFCTDFDLVLAKGADKRGVTKDFLVSIFKRIASNTRLMSFSQFIESLDRIAEAFYTPELDKVLNTSFAYFSAAEKRDLLYKHMSLSEFSKYHSKKKNFGLAFSPEKNMRIPRNESSHKYKFKVSEELLRKLEDWKKDKKTRGSPQPLMPIKEASPARPLKNNSGILRYSGKASQTGVRNILKTLQSNRYAFKSRVKKVEMTEEDKETEKIEEKEVQERVITIQGLSSMRFEEFDEDMILRDLLVDDKDEYFDKFYGIDSKLQGIMKMHDSKVAKGQRVLEKSKYRFN